MIERRKTVVVKVGPVKLGSSEPIVIQSMTKVPTTDVQRCVGQIERLGLAGCRLVRLAVATRPDSAAFGKIVGQVTMPLIADIHFSPERAVEAIEAGAAKIRLNPGNIKCAGDINRIIDAAKCHNTAIRIGINEASIRNLKGPQMPAEKRVSFMLSQMRRYVRIFEKRGFGQLVLSAKSSDCYRTIQINRLIGRAFNYPIHVGLTHAGLAEHARIPSAVSLGTLLAEGIGDTIRVSAAGDAVEEALIAKEILAALGLQRGTEPELVVCPSCARAQMDVIKLAKIVNKVLKNVHKPLRVAVMGCIVNGPGEAADADLAVCCGKNKAYLYRKGRRIAMLAQSAIVPALLKELGNL